jgi:hypothetical protein
MSLRQSARQSVGQRAFRFIAADFPFFPISVSKSIDERPNLVELNALGREA